MPTGYKISTYKKLGLDLFLRINGLKYSLLPSFKGLISPPLFERLLALVLPLPLSYTTLYVISPVISLLIPVISPGCPR